MASATQMVLVPSKYLDGELDVANFAHEITHKWWGGMVVDRGERGQLMSSETMAQLGALLEAAVAADAAFGRTTGAAEAARALAGRP